MKELFSVRYTLASMAVIAIWWMMAFKQPIANEAARLPTENIPYSPTLKTDYPLSTIERHQLHRALCGDVELMAAMMASWELDAGILERAGIEGVKHLDQEEQFRAALLARLLLSDNVKEHELQARYPLIVDDVGNPIDLQPSIRHLLPQTYVSAGILLALSDPEAITALPYGIRSQTQLYPPEITSAVSANIDSTTREELMMMQPDIAIAAEHYSNPAMLEALRQMKITLFLHRNISTLDDIYVTTQALGHLAGHPLKAELMVLFMKAALNAIDNTLLSSGKNDGSSTLIVGFHTRFSLPGKKMLTYRYQERLGITPCFSYLENSDWEVPISEEQILAANPRKLIIIAPEIPHLKEQLLNRPAIRDLIHYYGTSICFLDEEIQKTPCQHHVLAYYDLVNAIK